MKAILTGATVIGAGKLFEIGGVDTHTLHVVFTGSISALTVAIEGSINGTDVVALATHELATEEISAKSSMFHIVNKLVEYVRVNITVMTGSGSVTVYHSPATAASKQID